MFQNQRNNEFLMFYNVENLFLPDTNPEKRLSRGRSGLYGWNGYRYQQKLKKIAKVADLFYNQQGKLPILIGLAEIQGKKVLRDLLDQEVFEGYDFVHFDSLDERGVDVALLYEKNKVQVLYTEPISFFFKINSSDPDAYDTTRDVLFCKLKIFGEVLNLFVVHLPSKQKKDVNKPRRDFILKRLSDKISEIMTNLKEPVIIMGDFNENPNEESMKKLTNDSNNHEILTNPYDNLFYDEKYTTFYGKDGMVFDQMLLSKQFFEAQTVFLLEKADVFDPNELKNAKEIQYKRPFRTYSGSRYLGGYSDHFPIFIKLIIENS